MGKVREWVEQQQGKHICQCGCGQPITIIEHHWYVGIPRFFLRHRLPKEQTWKDKADLWARQEQGKHFCGCGCGRPLVIKRQHMYQGLPTYVMGHPPHKGNTKELFWELVNKSDGCWLWTGSKDRAGYGEFPYQGKNWRAHRLSYVFANGLIADDVLVCHKCDNPPCVRPSHLFLGAHSDNSQDAMLKGRMAKKFDKSTILKVVSLVRSGMYAKQAAKEVGMSCSMAYAIMTGEVWSHVTGITVKEKQTNGR